MAHYLPGELSFVYPAYLFLNYRRFFERPRWQEGVVKGERFASGDTPLFPAEERIYILTKGYSWTLKEEDGLIKSYFLKNTD